MTNFILFFLLEAAFGFATFNLGRWFQWTTGVSVATEEDINCPHGADWEDCPDCRH